MKSLPGLLSVFLVVSICTICSAQQSVEVSQQLKSYYSNVNTAESFIVKGDLKEALHAYKEAFKVYPQGFSSHYRNAYILAIKLKDKASAQMMASYLIRRGACRDFFNVYPLPMTTEEFNKFFDFNAKDVKVNLEYRAALNMMLDKQQDALENDATPEVLAQINQENYTSFNKLVDQYGYPDIKNLGLSCGMFMGGFDDLAVRNLLHSFCSAKNPGIELILTDALIKGQLLNTEYTNFLSLINVKDKPAYGDGPIYLFNEGYFEDISYSNIKDKIDANRKAIGLCTYNEQILRIKFKTANPDSPFDIGTPVKKIGIAAKSLNGAVKPFVMVNKS